MKQPVRATVNGDPVELMVEPDWPLVRALRDGLGLTGVREGCGVGECGACTVIVDGKSVNSCLYPAMEAEGREITTIEGLSDGRSGLHPLQKAFVENGGVQCGFCTPGMIMSAKALLDENPDPTEMEIRRGLAGNICRCTGYNQIVASVKAAAKEMGEG